MTTTKTIGKDPIETQNPCWGFFGTVMLNYGPFGRSAADDAKFMARLFDRAVRVVHQRIQKDYGVDVGPEGARAFLDSTHGRHLADALSFHGATKGASHAGLVACLRMALMRPGWTRAAVALWNDGRAA